MMSDETLDKLGTYFVYHNVLMRYQITFERFLKRVENDVWEAWLA